jgi:hypothetical protein
MNRIWKTVLCAVMLASFIGCGGDDAESQEGVKPDECKVDPERCTVYEFIGLNTTSAIVNFGLEANKSELKLSRSLFGIELLLPDSLDKYVRLLGTGAWGGKYVVKKLTNETQAHEYLNSLVSNQSALVNLGKFNRGYISQFLDLTIIGAKLGDLLDKFGLNDGLRKYTAGIDFSVGEIEFTDLTLKSFSNLTALWNNIKGIKLFNDDGLDLGIGLYVERAGVDVEKLDDGQYIVTLTSYVTGSFKDFDDSHFDKVYGKLDAPVVATVVEKLYSPHVLTNDYILLKYLDSLVEKDGFTLAERRQAVKVDDGVTYSIAFDHGADIVTWSVEKDVNHLTPRFIGEVVKGK